MDTVIRPRGLAAPHFGMPWSVRAAFIANAVALVGGLVALFTVQPTTATMRVGNVAGATIVAQSKVKFDDSASTAVARDQAMRSVAPIYHYNPGAMDIRRAEAAQFLSRSVPILASRAGMPWKLSQLKKLLPPDVSSSALQQFPSLTPADFRVVRQMTMSLLSQATTWTFSGGQITPTAIGLLSNVSSRVTVAQRNAISDLLITFLTPTSVVDVTATDALRVKAAKRVHEVRGTIFPGEVIIRRGDLVTPTVVNELKALGYQTGRTGWQDIAGSLLFSAIIVTMLFWYLHAFQTAIVTKPRLLLLIDVSILATVAGARILSDNHVLLPYFLPVAAASTFAAVLIAPEACIAITLAMAVLAGWIAANSFELTMYYFLGGAAGVLAIRQVHRVKQFILAGGYITVFSLLTALAFELVARTYDLESLQEFVLAAAFNGFASSTLALGGFALLSGFFGVTTSLQLLELGQPNQPLLRRLMVRAPGTYNHSLIVASMVERAAEDVEANSLVAKVGALYHDVGKTANPHCFSENQLGIGNIHDELTPSESVRIIRGHVQQGLRLARQHKLPRVVLDAIEEHHGTMTIAYFLHKARQDGEVGDPSLYRYPGPRPQSKETALLMLADGCESAVRASADHSPGKIEEMVARIFTERVESGQLDECPLTLRDLERMRRAFCAVLNGLYHPRIEYPESVETLASSVRAEATKS